jgi:hypothetical protein
MDVYAHLQANGILGVCDKLDERGKPKAGYEDSKLNQRACIGSGSPTRERGPSLTRRATTADSRTVI